MRQLISSEPASEWEGIGKCKSTGRRENSFKKCTPSDLKLNKNIEYMISLYSPHVYHCMSWHSGTEQDYYSYGRSIFFYIPGRTDCWMSDG